MVVTAILFSSSCSNADSDTPALVHVRELQAEFIGEAPCVDSSGDSLGCGVQIHPAPGEENAPVSSMTLGDWRFSYDYAGDRSLVGWNFLGQWAESVGCAGFGEWVLASDSPTVLVSCDRASQSFATMSQDIVDMTTAIYKCDGSREGRYPGCGVDIGDSLNRVEPFTQVDMETVYFSYHRSSDRDVGGTDLGAYFLKVWAINVGCDNALDDWVYDDSTIEVPPTPCSGDINEGWVARDASFSDCFPALARRSSTTTGSTLCATGNLKSGRLVVEFDYTEEFLDLTSSASWLGTYSCRNPRQGTISSVRGDWEESQISGWAYQVSAQVLEWC